MKKAEDVNWKNWPIWDKVITVVSFITGAFLIRTFPEIGSFLLVIFAICFGVYALFFVLIPLKYAESPVAETMRRICLIPTSIVFGALGFIFLKFIIVPQLQSLLGRLSEVLNYI